MIEINYTRSLERGENYAKGTIRKNLSVMLVNVNQICSIESKEHYAILRWVDGNSVYIDMQSYERIKSEGCK